MLTDNSHLEKEAADLTGVAFRQPACDLRVECYDLGLQK